jgi:hypothetical protein
MEIVSQKVALLSSRRGQRRWRLGVGGDQVGDVVLIEALAQAPWTFALGLEASLGVVTKHRVKGLRSAREDLR